MGRVDWLQSQRWRTELPPVAEVPSAEGLALTSGSGRAASFCVLNKRYGGRPKTLLSSDTRLYEPLFGAALTQVDCFFGPL